MVDIYVKFYDMRIGTVDRCTYNPKKLTCSKIF